MHSSTSRPQVGLQRHAATKPKMRRRGDGHLHRGSQLAMARTRGEATAGVDARDVAGGADMREAAAAAEARERPGGARVGDAQLRGGSAAPRMHGGGSRGSGIGEGKSERLRVLISGRGDKAIEFFFSLVMWVREILDFGQAATTKARKDGNQARCEILGGNATLN